MQFPFINPIHILQRTATPLFYASRNGRLLVVKWILNNRAGVDIDAPSDDVNSICFSSCILFRHTTICASSDLILLILSTVGSYTPHRSSTCKSPGGRLVPDHKGSWCQPYIWSSVAFSIYLLLLLFLLYYSWNLIRNNGGFQNGFSPLHFDCPLDITTLLVERGANVNSANFVRFSSHFFSLFWWFRLSFVCSSHIIRWVIGWRDAASSFTRQRLGKGSTASP